MLPFNPLEKFALNGVASGFSRASDGNMSLSFGDTRFSLQNREKFLSVLGIDHRDLVTAKQVHGNSVRLITQKDKGRGALTQESAFDDTDGFVTGDRNVPLAILTADCLSVFIYDPNYPAIACLHAGWRSTEKNIVSAGVKLMRENFSSKPQELFAGFGPSIGSCCFEVEKDFKSNFGFGLFEKEGRLFMDIALVNRRQLLECGLKDEHIFDPQLCTFCGKDMFSFRKQGADSGRLISVIMLK